MTMEWWHWLLVGLVLLGMEIMTPGGFFIVFFGVGALVVGLLVGAGLVTTLWMEWLLFSTVSIASLVLFRKRLLDRFKTRSAQGPHDVPVLGEVATLVEDLAPGAVGKAEMRGTSWSVRSREDRMLPRGTRCRVVEMDGLMLWVKAE
jgi:membrane protein implicated in regulation of membrane protease activity